MHVRPADHGDILDVAHLLHEHVQRRGPIEVCRSRASATVRQGMRRGAFALVACDDDSVPLGFCYAEQVIALELVPKVFHYHVLYLTGRHCAVPLLRDLRKRTGSRILFPAHAHWGNMEAYRRLLRRAVPAVKQVGAMFEI